MYEFLELSTIINNTDILFLIKLPLFKKEIFSFRRLIPLPMNNTEFVITPNNVLIHGNKIHYYKGKCQLVRKIYICKNDKSISQINSKCITRLLRGKEAECETKDVGLVATIFEPEAGYVKLQTDCGVQNKAMVNNVQYEAVEMLGRAELKLNIPRIETIKRNRTTQELGIHELRMEDLETKIQISRIQ